MKTIHGRVIKAVASKFVVDTENGVKVCFARKKLKSDGNIFVGDWVEIAKDRDIFVIEEVCERKNVLIRPYVCNVDICLIIIASEPEPDFVLVDKILVNCLQQNIKPILVINKCDLEIVKTEEYNGVCDRVLCSCESGVGIEELLLLIRGKTVCFAGQSAVGKSSIINAIFDTDLLPVGELAKKIKRGKHTTRTTEILAIADTYFVDTCGFSMLDTIDIEPEDLRFYFDDLEKYRNECFFSSCTHIEEPDCAVKPHVGIEIGEGRYTRYKTIFTELDDRRKKKYD